MTKTIRKLFFVWGEEKESAWLSEMAKNGWHLTGTSFITYYFEKGAPGDFTYRFDFNPIRHDERREYLQLFNDSGWEHCGNMGSWFYFRKEKGTEGADDIFTDKESRIAKYRRLLIFLYLCSASTIFNALNPHFPSFSDIRNPSWFVIKSLMIFGASISSFAIIRTHIMLHRFKHPK